MFILKRLQGAAAIVGIAATATITTPTMASPGSGVTSTVLATSNLDEDVQLNSNRVKFQTKDATDLRTQKLEFAPGSFSGWHSHPGIAIVLVASGSVTLEDTSCGTETHAAGTVFVEGEGHVHQAKSAGGATVYVTYVAPNASPPTFRIEEQVPFCAQGGF